MSGAVYTHPAAMTPARRRDDRWTDGRVGDLAELVKSNDKRLDEVQKLVELHETSIRENSRTAQRAAQRAAQRITWSIAGLGAILTAVTMGAHFL